MSSEVRYNFEATTLKNAKFERLTRAVKASFDRACDSSRHDAETFLPEHVFQSD